MEIPQDILHLVHRERFRFPEAVTSLAEVEHDPPTPEELKRMSTVRDELVFELGKLPTTREMIE